jgi:hypothetical protein
MPDNNYHHLVYEDLLELEQGYADALLDHFSNGDDAEQWVGLRVEDLSSASLKIIARDCRRFYSKLLAQHPDAETEILEQIDEYELGRSFFLERMEVGISFNHLHLEREHVHWLIGAAGEFKPFEAEPCKCGGICIVGQPPATGLIL